MARKQNDFLNIGLFILLFHPALSQEPDGNFLGDLEFRKITFSISGFAFPDFNDDTQLEPDDEFDFSDETKLVGFNFGINYNLINGISMGIGTGIETFYDPDFDYVPLVMRIALNGGTARNSIHTEVSLGGHFTNVGKTGILFRFYLGYRFRVIKGLFANASMIYTFQNLYQSFENSKRLDSYYNFESLGLSIGFDLN